MKLKYSKLSEYKISQLKKAFLLNASARKTAETYNVNRNTVNRYFKIFRQNISNNISIQQQKIISFEYLDKHNKKIPIKKAQPLKIVNFKGLWYLIFLNTKNEIRKYYLKEISNIKMKI